jgi:hypothetical protein
MLNPEFIAAFNNAKERIRAMDFRFVEETDQNAQTLLEIYCTLAPKCPVQRFRDALIAP